MYTQNNGLKLTRFEVRLGLGAPDKWHIVTYRMMREWDATLSGLALLLGHVAAK